MAETAIAGPELLPPFTPSGVLPPFHGADATDVTKTSPYLLSMTELVNTFATSQERADILRGLLGYRAALGAIGITAGFQLMDGSFVEECEKQRGRPPSDIDIVTFAHRPTSDAAAWKALLAANQHLFDPQVTKNSFKCDAYFVDLNIPPVRIVQQTFYWWGLFSHQKATALWKGVVVVNLASDDAAAARLL